MVSLWMHIVEFVISDCDYRINLISFYLMMKIFKLPYISGWRNIQNSSQFVPSVDPTNQLFKNKYEALLNMIYDT
jgi:hypothetical protein